MIRQSTHPLRVSVVVITAGRRQCLPPCIESLRNQTYRPMELVVVVGPSKDGTAGYASTLTDAKVCSVARLNVGHARNEGVRRAGGDIIAFIDDDAIAHPRWLEEMVGVFEREGPDCGGVGGYVVNENDPGRPVQARNNTINDLGEPDEVRLAPADRNDPAGPVFNYFMGANMAFRREAILAAGGCDELYTYHYEDADLSVAVIRAGYRILHHGRALVHHFPAASHNRRSAFDRNYYAIARHQMYFSLKFSRRSALRCLWGVGRTKLGWLRMFARLTRSLTISPWAAARFSGMAFGGLASGLRHGLRYRRHGRVPVLTPDLPRPEFVPVSAPATLGAARPHGQWHGLRVALLCGEFGGPVFGGVGRYTQHLAEALAALGHSVVVLRSGWSKCRVKPEGYEVVDVPAHGHPAVYRALFLFHLRRLAARRDFDIVEAPLWNGEGIAIGAAARWPLVVRLETPFEVTRQLSGLPLTPDIVALIAAEQLQLAYAAGTIGISRAVVDTVEETYATRLASPGRRLAVIPLGMPSASGLVKHPVEAPEFGGTRYLFVGRLEARKGVVELGRAFARVAERDPKASLWVVGADNSEHDGFKRRTGKDYLSALRAAWGKSIADRVHFHGKVTDEEKNYLYSACDVLVAPSRYESFGLVFVEAMRCGKPVIGTDTGGIPEVVENGTTGLLVPPESPDELADAMRLLGENPDLRRRMGAAGLRRFEQTFSLYGLGRQTEAFYRQVLEDWHGTGGGAGRPRIASPSVRYSAVRRAA